MTALEAAIEFLENGEGLHKLVVYGVLMTREEVASLLKPPTRMRCQKCNAPRQGVTCHKCGSELKVTPDNWDELELPDVARIRALAREVGYALAVHGSLERDLDVIAIPWTTDAVGNHALIEHLAKGLDARIVDIERKPLGRYAATLKQRIGWIKSIDLSVTPQLKDDHD